MWISDELEPVVDYVTVWWDLDKDEEYHGAPTGTPTQPYPNVQRREISRAYLKKVHKNCGGDVVLADEQGDLAPYHVLLVCLACKQEILAGY